MTPSLAIDANNHALARHATVYLGFLVLTPRGDNLYASDGVRKPLYSYDTLTLTRICKQTCLLAPGMLTIKCVCEHAY